MLFLDGYAGDGPNLRDIRSQGYGDGYPLSKVDEIIFRTDSCVLDLNEGGLR